ncbi:hypothetical protein [Chryseobacterium sp.]|uniref:hypothetical protein n=1 Tax=Chryseobacterium sp. TaxID=1871047 RepID=UPI0024E1DFC7|nr:hypothetical protein [Chryseobacterium sp.]
MKIKLLTFLSLSMLLASCAQDDTLDNVTVKNEAIQTNQNNSEALDIGFTKVTPIKEVVYGGILNAGEAINLVNFEDTYQLVMQYDHNLVLYKIRSGHSVALWSSNTRRTDLTTPSVLLAQNDGNMVIYNNNIPIWNTNKTVGYHINDPHMKLQLFKRTGTFIPPGYRIKLVLSGNGQNINDIIEVDF